MSVEISKGNRGTETNFERWLHVSSEMVVIHFVHCAWRMADTHRRYDVPGQGSSVHFLHKMKDKHKDTHKGKTN